MDLRQLHYFLATMEHRSIGRAAAALNVTQPALSKAIRRLELELDVKLLERLPRGVVPTIYGEALAAHASVIGLEIGRAKAAVTDLRDGGVGQVVVGAGSSMRIELLPEACVRVREKVPGAEIKIIAELYDDLIPDLQRGELDFVLSMIPDYEMDPDLVHVPLYVDENHPCARPGHPLMAMKRVEPEDCLECGWVLPASSNLPRQYLDAYFHSRRLPPPRVVIETNSAVFTESVLAKSDLLGLLPTQVINHSVGSIVALPAPEITLSRTVGLTHRRASVLSPLARLLIDELVGVAGDMIARGTVWPLKKAREARGRHNPRLSERPAE